MSDIFDEQKEWEDIEGADLPDVDEFQGFEGDPAISESKLKTEKEVYQILLALKNHKLEGGGTITGFKLTITNKKTGEKKVVKI